MEDLNKILNTLQYLYRFPDTFLKLFEIRLASVTHVSVGVRILAAENSDIS